MFQYRCERFCVPVLCTPRCPFAPHDIFTHSHMCTHTLSLAQKLFALLWIIFENNIPNTDVSDIACLCYARLGVPLHDSMPADILSQVISLTDMSAMVVMHTRLDRIIDAVISVKTTTSPMRHVIVVPEPNVGTYLHVILSLFVSFSLCTC